MPVLPRQDVAFALDYLFHFYFGLPIAQLLVCLGIGGVRMLRVAVCTSPRLIKILTVSQNQGLFDFQLGVGVP